MDNEARFPDVIFIGPLKTATSYIYDYFLHHPNVATSEPVKELFYYDDYYEKGKDWYLRHFPVSTEHQVTIDVAPSYMIRDVAMMRIKKDNPNVKIIMTLRDPIERFSSHVKHHIRHGYRYTGFSDLLAEHPRIIQGSQYDEYVDQWVEAFGEENVFFLDYSQLKQDPRSFMKKTCDVIGVPFSSAYKFDHKVNSAGTSTSRNPLLMRCAYMVTRFLVKNGLSGVIDTLKGLGIKKFFFKEGKVPTISEEDIQEAKVHLAGSTKWYNERFKVTS